MMYKVEGFAKLWLDLFDHYVYTQTSFSSTLIQFYGLYTKLYLVF